MNGHPILRVVRITFEATAPVTVASGEPSLTTDVMLVRDPNALPMLPGTSLAGVLRAAILEISDSETIRELFGDSLHDRRDPKPGRLSVSDALCQDSKGRVVDGFAPVPDDDAVLKLLSKAQPVLRDHVRLNERGAVDGAGKFTRAAVPRGTRFLAQLEFWDDAEEHPAWRLLYDSLTETNVRLRIGGATRSGYGTVKVKTLETRQFDMRVPDNRLAARTVLSLQDSLSGRIHEPKPTENSPDYLLQLLPQGAFRFGQGESDDDPADLRPIRETTISWSGGNAPSEITEQLFVPASALKGALRHRTEFHYRRLKGEFIGHEPASEAALDALFGCARDGDGGERDLQGEAGRVFIDDISLLDATTRRIDRTGIDRFSGGVRRKALFNEDVVECDGPVTLCIALADPEKIEDEHLVPAFEHALADLAHGWLALGAGGTKGLGAFRDPDPDPRLASRFAERTA